MELTVDAHLLVAALDFNDAALRLNLDGLTHEECLLQPSSGNCINWVLGHIVRHRNFMLEALGAPTVWSTTAQERYERGSAPIEGANGRGVVHLEELRREFDRSGENLRVALVDAEDEALRAASGTTTLGRRLLSLALHEAYHVGQVAVLRRLAGKEGAIR